MGSYNLGHQIKISKNCSIISLFVLHKSFLHENFAKDRNTL